ncbi:MAG: carbohydrate kinase family protein [Saprospiraceae bacterium]
MRPTLICFGEVLWDLLPTGKIAGGAPMNVAFQANQLGLSAKMASRVGADDLGEALLSFLDEKGVSTQFVQTDPQHPTGIVNVTLDPQGSPAYEIVQPSAWDFIAPDGALHDTVMEADAFVFGSLACRAEGSRSTLLELLDVAALRVFDVNLRRPFFSQNLLDALLSKADIVKMNDEELAVIAAWSGAAAGSGEAAQMQFLKEKYALDMLVLTKGPHGAACFDELGYCAHSGFRVQVSDTIGSGDAFLAAFLSQLLAGAESRDCLDFGCAYGALVATKQGGTPDIGAGELRDFVSQARR